MAEHPELAGGNSLAVAYSGCSAARLYAAAVRSVGELGFTVVDQNPTASTLTFRTPGPTPTWPGLEMRAAITEDGDGARLVIGGNRFSGYERQGVVYRGSKDIGTMFLARVKAILPTIAEPAPVTTPAPSRLDQLQSLGDLRDRGVLTQDEFEAEKKRLLG
jgi:hypothetical protein